MADRRKLELAGYALAGFVLVFLALRLLQHDSSAAPVSLEPAGAAGRTPPAARAATTASARTQLVVDVAGEVRRPGVYRVPAGSRADAAVQLAGGVTAHAERAAVNLAMPLHDGQQVVVPRHGAAALASAPGAGSAGTVAQGGAAAPNQPISLSSATAEQLDTLDGIGPTLAQRIIQYRDAHGGFKSVDELRQVSGIGEKRFAALRKAVQP